MIKPTSRSRGMILDPSFENNPVQYSAGNKRYFVTSTTVDFSNEDHKMRMPSHKLTQIATISHIDTERSSRGARIELDQFGFLLSAYIFEGEHLCEAENDFFYSGIEYAPVSLERVRLLQGLKDFSSTYDGLDLNSICMTVLEGPKVKIITEDKIIDRAVDAVYKKYWEVMEEIGVPEKLSEELEWMKYITMIEEL